MLTCGAAALESRAAQRLAGFAGFLRANGFTVGGGDAVQVLSVAERVGALDARVLRWSLQALLCGRSDEWRRFDALFDAWFLRPNRWQRPEPRETLDRGRSGVYPGAPGNQRVAHDENHDALRPRDAASDREVLRSADFRTLMQREHLLEIEALMRRFARRLKHIRLRREARARLVLLVDVSRSMAAYSFFYLRLARALSAELTDLRSFIFHTRLTAVSDALRETDPWRAQERLHLLAQGWAGGTRIGECLAQFNREHAPRCVHSRTAVIILSDGYDTGEPGRLSGALAELRRRARRIVWLNPLYSRPDYAPVSAGMQAALPHLDLLAPGADLASLEATLPDIIEALR